MKKPFLEYAEKELGNNFVLIACGLPGTWKTETTAEVARIKGYPLLRSDIIRLEVLKNEDVFDAKVAADMKKRTSVYDEMFRRADEALNKNDGVVLDATFISQELRRRAAAIAAKHNKTFVIEQTDCPQEISVSRILLRTREDYKSNALTEEAYLNNKKNFEKVDLADLKKLYPKLPLLHLTVDTCHDDPKDWMIISIDRK